MAGTIVLPVETKSRELYGKVWLALHLVECGNNVIIGDKRVRKEIIDLSDIDFFFTGGVASKPTTGDFLPRLKNHGVTVGALETEGAVYSSINDYSQRMSTAMMDYTDVYFSWGQNQTIHLKDKFPQYEDIFYTTGVPSFDLLQEPLYELYKPSPDHRLKTYEPYYLINTNFGRVNHYTDPFDYTNTTKLAHPQGKLLQEFVNSIISLSEEFEHYNFVIRPHPSEDDQVYKNETSSISNVFVEYQDDVRTWIYSAKGVLHNGCTTGIESILMGKHTIAFDPIHEYEPSPLPNEASIQVTEYSELKEVISEINGSSDTPIQIDSKTILSNWFYNLKIDFSAELISKVTTEFISENNVSKRQVYSPKPEIKLKRYIKNIPKIQTVKPAYRHLFEKEKALYKKFPGLEESELSKIINKLTSYSNFDSVKIDQLNNWDDMYLLSPG